MSYHTFSKRHIGPSKSEIKNMLEYIGVDSTDDLVSQTIPDNILRESMVLDAAMTEHEFLNHIQKLGDKNQIFKSYIGLGYHECVTPSPVKRNILENPGWYTAYTPYQPEIAQGRLEALINYQTMITDLTGMELANASLLDEGTAASEAMTMLFALRSREQKKQNTVKFFVSETVLPQTVGVLKTKAKSLGIDIIIGDHNTIKPDGTFYGQLLQYPAKYGEVYDYAPFVHSAKTLGIKTVVAADILSLALLKPPGEWGVDVVVGTTQRFGIPLGYGGPHAAYFATLDAYKRYVPGRIIGLTKDTCGKKAYRMALQTREQHIKKEKATSNICTSQVLPAVMSGMYAVYHGENGIREIAATVHQKTKNLEVALSKLGFQNLNTSYFDTLKIDVNSAVVRKIAEKKRINFLYISDDIVGISINEATTDSDLSDIIAVFSKVAGKEVEILLDDRVVIGENLMRKSPFLKDEVFNRYHSETALMRYIKSLERKDLSLNHSMIPLGSCTMKLNAASELLPLSMSKWSDLHPFVPEKQAQGYRYVLTRLEKQLNVITGFSATSLQPNSGAQGEYAGLIAIQSYHKSRGEAHRDVCIIPESAHGTNFASAVLAGMKIIVVKTTEKGNVNVSDLRDKAEQYKDHLSAFMITYPSTNGVFEASIREVTAIIHDCGGQVYMDGANMNAQVGFTSPAKIGADVCHLNLHKTFAIPHGGGGPGVGPICVAEHLADFLPSNPIVFREGTLDDNCIAAAPFGSALVCLISYGYICMLGSEGMTEATSIAILNANYIKTRLEKHFEILYKGEKGRIAHEMIVDCRSFKAQGISVIDIAKRLMDYGFHAPTVSFPVGGTLMIEPTESENKAELDRFCDAMISIKEEIFSQPQLLKNAPHTLELITSDEWTFPYTRKQAAYPMDYLKDNKFWTGVSRVDDAHGDRNLICTCNTEV